jgi:hypothetical protein
MQDDWIDLLLYYLQRYPPVGEYILVEMVLQRTGELSRLMLVICVEITMKMMSLALSIVVLS